MEAFLANFDIFLLEAVVNGLLLGGLFALLSLGLNLIFGVIDVVWICYAELIMIGMYTIWWLHVPQGVSLWVAFPLAVLLVAGMGAVLHYFVIRPVLAAEPINQLLVTGGVLFLLQALATVIFGIDFRNLGVRMPGFSVGDMYLSTARLLAFAVALAAIAATWWFLRRTFTGVAIRAISQDRAIMPLMGVNPGRVYLVTSAIGGALAGLAACLLVLQYDIHPAIGLSFGPLTFLICVMGGLGNLVGGFVASFIFAQFISVGGFLFHLEWGYVIAFAFFIAMMFWRPQGILARSGR
ncbi:MAG: branched-chain amino acid ABC transporter permease [Burkholderiaceae bacterium]|nr:branched-chain amino acid ABC transporter permease [Burkholderiaceae bacterium]